MERLPSSRNSFMWCQEEKREKKRPKLMSLGRSIQLSGLYWEIKSSSLLLFPFAALYDEGWEGGWKEGPRISDVSYCRERRWQLWHLADETMNCLLRPPRPVERGKQIDALWSQKNLIALWWQGCGTKTRPVSRLSEPEKRSTSFGVVVRPVDVQLFGADGRSKREKRRVVSA